MIPGARYSANPFAPASRPQPVLFQGRKPTANALAVPGGDAFTPEFVAVEPAKALAWTFDQSLTVLKKRLGEQNLKAAMSTDSVYPSPVANEQNSRWLKKQKMVGINPRAIGSYWDIVKYALTFPEEAIHLMPTVETGACGSLYAPTSWHMNPEFLDANLTKLGFETPEKQLKVVINVLHAMGKTVGMDVQGHTDRYSETVFAHPDFFEWIQLNASKTAQVRNDDGLYKDVQKEVLKFLKQHGVANGQPLNQKVLSSLFKESTPESKRLEILFGPQADLGKRTARRITLMNHVRAAGFESVPVAAYAPYRPIVFKEMKSDGNGNTWAEFQVKDKSDLKIFGSIAPYKWYAIKDDGSIDGTRQNTPVWDYYASKLAGLQKEFGFDFMRADMGHLQTRPEGIRKHSADPLETGTWAHVKKTIQKQAPHFATFAESFLVYDDTAYGDPFKNIDANLFDTALGVLHVRKVGREYPHRVREYNLSGITHNIETVPAVGLMTTDSDHPHWSHHYYGTTLANKVRAFFGFFLNQPSYMGAGLETRDENPENPRGFSNRYIEDWTKYNKGPYQWGQNTTFFNSLTTMRKLYLKLKNTLQRDAHHWLNTRADGTTAWVYYNAKTQRPDLLCVVNADTEYAKDEAETDNPLEIPPLAGAKAAEGAFGLKPIYSTTNEQPRKLEALVIRKGKPVKITNLAPGEARIYQVVKSRKT